MLALIKVKNTDIETIVQRIITIMDISRAELSIQNTIQLLPVLLEPIVLWSAMMEIGTSLLIIMKHLSNSNHNQLCSIIIL